MSASPRELLTAYALGLLEPEERAAVERSLAADPALAAEHAEIVAHLALYERFPAPAEPPGFTGLVARLGPQEGARTFWLRRSLFAAAAVLVVGLGAAALFESRTTVCPHFGSPGAGLQVDGQTREFLSPGDLLSTERPAEAHFGGRVRLVLGGASALRLRSHDEVELVRGRAFFDVGPGAFRVRTSRGAVDVLGTRFEVDVREGLVVGVAEGRVRVGALEVGPGERLAGGVVSPATEEAGTFFRRPVLLLEGPGTAKPGEVVQLRLVLENPTHVPQVVRGPETVATGALLTLTDPTGRIATQGLDFARAVSGGLTAVSPITLGPLERRLTVFEVAMPSAPSGSWRLSALYRPQGEAPIASEPFTLEVR